MTLCWLHIPIQEIHKINSLLHRYEVASGQAVNTTKSKLYGINMPPHLLQLMARSIGMTLDKLPSIYLGLPLFQGGNVGNFWESIVAKFHAKMATWQNNWLSSVGRLTKIKAVLSALTIFWMGVFWIPRLILDNMERIIRNFLWHGVSEPKKTHLVAWD